MGKIILRIVLCLVLLMIYRIVVYVIAHKKEFAEYIKSDDFTFSGLVSMMDFNWLLFNKTNNKQPVSEYVRADAKVIDKECSAYESYDDKGNLSKETTYKLKIKFYAGNQSVTTTIESDKYDDNVEICYNAKNPYEVYPADDKRFGNLSKNERIENTFSALWSVFGYAVVAIVIFYPLIFDK